MSPMRGGLLWLLAAFSAACQLEVAYDGRFSCSEPPYTCPQGLSCSRGECVDLSTPPPPGPNPRIDAGTDPDAESPRVDAAPNEQSADAATPDAPPLPPPPPPPEPFEMTFGERSNAQIRNVTFDTHVREDSPNANFGGNGTVAIDANPHISGLIEFDLSAVPAGSHCVSAELTVFVNDPIETGEYQIFA